MHGLSVGKEVLELTRPVAGRCIIEFEIPEKSGSIVIPDMAQGPRLYTAPQDVRDTNDTFIGRVLAMTPRKTKSGKEFDEDFAVGDRVVVALLQSDIEKKVILTENTRVRAVLSA